MTVKDFDNLDDNWRVKVNMQSLCVQKLALLGSVVCSRYTILAGGIPPNVKINATQSHSSSTRHDPALPQDDYGNNPMCTVSIIDIIHANNYINYEQC